MFMKHSTGILCLADHVFNGNLAKLVATQLGYDYQPPEKLKSLYFCARKGNVYLAVIEGHLTIDIVNFLINYLCERSFLEISALSIDFELDELDKKFTNVKFDRIPDNFLKHYQGY